MAISSKSLLYKADFIKIVFRKVSETEWPPAWHMPSHSCPPHWGGPRAPLLPAAPGCLPRACWEGLRVTRPVLATTHCRGRGGSWAPRPRLPILSGNWRCPVCSLLLPSSPGPCQPGFLSRICSWAPACPPHPRPGRPHPHCQHLHYFCLFIYKMNTCLL